MESGKSPGTDGHPAEFCKVFCKDVSPFLISSPNRSYQNENLAITQRRGIISLVQKKRQSIKRIEELEAHNPV